MIDVIIFARVVVAQNAVAQPAVKRIVAEVNASEISATSDRIAAVVAALEGEGLRVAHRRQRPDRQSGTGSAA